MRIRSAGSVTVAIAVACAVGALVPTQPAAAQSPAPNVLIVVTDDQRAHGTLSVMPKVRRYFVRNGTTYTNAFASTPLCCPSRATIFTGRYAHNTRVRKNGHATRLDTTTIFPRLLQEAGYRTALVGKFLNAWPERTPPPYFDRFATLVLRRGQYVDPTFNVDGFTKRRAGYSTELIGGYAVRALRRFERRDSEPWLLYVATSAPHQPWIPAPRHVNARVGRWRGNPSVLERDRSDKPPFVRATKYRLADAQSVRAGQLRTLMSVDDMVGRIFSTLQRLHEKSGTFAIFTSDNGFLWADHGLGRKMRTGQKRLPYTASVKVPLLLRWPGGERAGATSRRLAGTVDIAPTVLDAAGVAADPAKPPLDGRSLLRSRKRNRVLLEYWREGNRMYPTWASTRTRSFQYVEYYRDDRQTVTPEAPPEHGPLSTNRLLHRLRLFQQAWGSSFGAHSIAPKHG